MEDIVFFSFLCYTDYIHMECKGGNHMSEKIYTIEELKMILQDILKNFAVKKAILFGSYAKNVPTSKSDIDLVIDSEGKLLNIYFYGLLEDLVQRLQKNIDLFEISEIEKDSKIYEDIQKEGIVVYER